MNEFHNKELEIHILIDCKDEFFENMIMGFLHSMMGSFLSNQYELFHKRQCEIHQEIHTNILKMKEKE